MMKRVNDPGKRLLNHLNKIEKAVAKLLVSINSYPELANSRRAKAVRSLLNDRLLQEVRMVPEKAWPPNLGRVVHHPSLGVLVHRIHGSADSDES